MVLGFVLGASLAWITAHPALLTRFTLPLDGLDRVPTPRLDAKLAQLRAQQPDYLPTTMDRDPYAIHPLARFSSVPVIMYHDVVAGRKDVWFDVTAAELRQHFEWIRQQGATPITLDQLYDHLSQGSPLPAKPIVLTFDDAYLGLYENAFPLLKEYNFHAAYFVQTGFVGVPTSKDHFTWEQMLEMQASGLVEFAPHTVNHPTDLRQLDDARLKRELEVSKQVLEERLGRPMHYFAYPTGFRDERVMAAMQVAGYKMSFTMDPGHAGQSANLLEVKRFDPSKFREALLGARFNPNAHLSAHQLNVLTPVVLKDQVVNRIRTQSLHGGRVATVHADQRYLVSTLVDRYQATAGINGSFFSIPWINSSSNIMVGPVLSAATHQFIPGRPEDIRTIRGRPLVLIGDDDTVRFLPFDPDTMNTLEGIRALMPNVRDLFVAGLWLVRDGKGLSREELESFRLSSAAEHRPRVYFGVDQDNLATVGVTDPGVTSLMLAQILPEVGLKEAILLDSGFSTSLVYENRILATGHAGPQQPSRPVPHAILVYDLTQLWQAQEHRRSALDRMVAGLSPSEQLTVKTRLQAILDGQQVLRRRERGETIRAIQQGLNDLAIAQQQPAPITSLDGVYGQELARALTQLKEPADAIQPLFTPDPPPEVDVIDAPLLRTLVEQLEALPPPSLVSLKVPRPIRDPNLKPPI
ncbi:MAG: polysaccharide deacetylase family protein [Thermostichales cyanobacterium SRBZ-1_bins_19]